MRYLSGIVVGVEARSQSERSHPPQVSVGDWQAEVDVSGHAGGGGSGGQLLLLLLQLCRGREAAKDGGGAVVAACRRGSAVCAQESRGLRSQQRVLAGRRVEKRAPHLERNIVGF